MTVITRLPALHVPQRSGPHLSPVSFTAGNSNTWDTTPPDQLTRSTPSPIALPIVLAPGLSNMAQLPSPETLTTRLLAMAQQIQQIQQQQAQTPTGNTSGHVFLAEVLTIQGHVAQAINLEGPETLALPADDLALAQLFAQQQLNPAPNTAIPPQAVLLLASDTLGASVTPSMAAVERLHDSKLVSPETPCVSLQKDSKGQLTLYVQPIANLFRWIAQPSMTQQPLTQLPIQRSAWAQQVMQAKGIDDAKLLALMTATQQQYQTVKPAGYTQRQDAAGVLTNGTTHTASKHEWWSPRLSELPDVLAASQAIQATLKQSPWAQGQVSWSIRTPNVQNTNPRVDAVAYFGDSADPIRPTALAKLTYPTFGSPDLLVVRVLNNTLDVRTAREYFNTHYFQG